MKEIFHRTSVRAFQDKPVEDEKIEKLLRAAMAAPSAGNQQPWEFYVVTDRQVLERLAAASPYAGAVKKAPLAIVSCSRKEGLKFPECVLLDMSLASQNIMLEADSLGLGSVMLAIAPVQERMDTVAEVLALPDDLEAFTIHPIGYPLKEAKQSDRFDAERIHRI